MSVNPSPTSRQAAGSNNGASASTIVASLGGARRLVVIAPPPPTGPPTPCRPEQATRMGPRGLGLVAKALLDTLDPEGAAPPEGEDRFDELHVLARRDGSLVL